MNVFDTVIKTEVCTTAYGYHQAVWDYMRETPTGKRNFVFRVRDNGLAAYIKIRSATKKEKCLDVVAPRTGDLCSLNFLATIDPRDLPSKTLDERQAIAWVLRKLALHGFEVSREDVDVTFLPWIEFGKPGADKWRFSRVEVSATATVVDAEKVSLALANGVCKGRSFGFGLLELEVL